MLLPAYDVRLLMWNIPATSALTRGVGNRLVNLVRTSVNTEPLAILKQRTIMTTSVAAVAPASADSLTGVKRKATTRVGTHNGTFHCDEVLGCFMIRLTDRYSEAEIVRTRDQTVLDTLDAVLDVGGVYSVENQRFDHHQKGFDEVFGHGFSTKLSSAGLVYKHFGREIIGKEMGLPADHATVEKLWLSVYKNFIEEIDGIDNGVNQSKSDLPPLYLVTTTLSARVGGFYPEWTETLTLELEKERFEQAMKYAGGEFMDRVKNYTQSWWPARSLVEDVLDDRHNVHPSGEILKLTSYCPWKSHLAELEVEQNIQPLPKYMLYEDERSKTWRIQAISLAPGSFESRKALPVAWRGLRDEELSAMCGIEGGVFIHMSGFIGGNKTYDGALNMAIKALGM